MIAYIYIYVYVFIDMFKTSARPQPQRLWRPWRPWQGVIRILASARLFVTPCPWRRGAEKHPPTQSAGGATDLRTSAIALRRMSKLKNVLSPADFAAKTATYTRIMNRTWYCIGNSSGGASASIATARHRWPPDPLQCHAWQMLPAWISSGRSTLGPIPRSRAQAWAVV